jgi:hypothetical protein
MRKAVYNPVMAYLAALLTQSTLLAISPTLSRTLARRSNNYTGFAKKLGLRPYRSYIYLT